MKSLSVFVSFLLLTVCSLAQELPQPYSIDDLKAGFYSQYVDKNENDALTKMEPLLSAYGRNFLDTFGDTRFLCPSESLHQAGKLNIPPSKFVFYEDSTSVERFILCWMDVLQDADSKENTALRKALQKKYGSIPMQGDTVLVPAKWFTGQLRILTNPFLYGDEVVSRRLQTDSVAEGSFVDWKDDQRHSYWAGSYLERDARMIMKRRTDSRVLVTMDGQRDTTAEHLQNERGMALFERDINRCIDDRLLPKELSFNKEYSIMLYLNEGGKARLSVLLPKELTLEDRLLLTVLATAVEYQPKNSFAGYVSARGRFPVVYLKAHFRGGKWFFHDYRWNHDQ